VIKYRGQRNESARCQREKGNVAGSAVDSLMRIIAGTERNYKAAWVNIFELPGVIHDGDLTFMVSSVSMTAIVHNI
jgi:hypothetical protein